MKEFSYIITDKNGVHARPAGELAGLAQTFGSDITITREEKKADAKRIFSILGLGIKSGDTVTVSICGEDEENALIQIREFMSERL